ncbi:MAG: hypothetical protein JW909_10865 [Planctomycetes bacterium]|nr:hypothetical protein [Planctomycetota bacterium]
MAKRRKYGEPYDGEYLDRVAFPLGGIGAGMVCIEGTGALSHLSVRNRPEVFNEPCTFAALCVKGNGNTARVIEGPVPMWKVFGPQGTGNGAGGKTYGLPRFGSAKFEARFPFGRVTVSDKTMPVEAEITAWSPFIPGNADDSSLPAAGLEYRLANRSGGAVSAVFSWNTRNFMAAGTKNDSVRAAEGGFVLAEGGSEEKPWEEGYFAAATDASDARVNCAWFRGGWFDPLTVAWRETAEGACYSRGPVSEGEPSPGASIYVPVELAPGEERTIRIMLAWYVPKTNLRYGEEADGGCCGAEGCCSRDAGGETHVPWYAGRFGSAEEVLGYWKSNYGRLKEETEKFSECFYDTDLPAEAVEAVAANLTILKSPTVLRQTDGRIWAWEGCCDGTGCCAGSCTHVWNYAQAMPHLFPGLERTLRATEFNESQDDSGHQAFRSGLPIREIKHGFHAAADGQLGGIMKVYREWRISGDTEWMRSLWPKVRKSLEYCVETWDPGRKGVLEEPHHNTYDIEFWGPDGMCGGFYLGALKAAALMGGAIGEDVGEFEKLYGRGRKYLEKELYNGEYFFQDVKWEGLRAGNPVNDSGLRTSYSPEALELLEKEGPKYQYGKGCLSDGVLGAWMAEVCGVGEILSASRVRSHLKAVARHNYRKDLSGHANPQRPSYAVGSEGGLLVCTWPRGDKLTLPFPYSDEVWTGIEYHVASHLMMMGRATEGLKIVRAARDRYDGRHRNPFNEYECGHWYARAMSSYGLLQGLSGARYDAVEKVLYLAPAMKGDFRAFICTASGYGTVGVRNGEPFFEAKEGEVEVRKIEYRAR